MKRTKTRRHAKWKRTRLWVRTIWGGEADENRVKHEVDKYQAIDEDRAIDEVDED